MDTGGIAKGLDQALYYILLGILALYSLMHLFVFIINWECWFFGMKMDGGNAGIILFAYFFVSLLLAALLLRYPRKIAEIALLSILFFSFAFLDSSVTVQALSSGLRAYTGFMAALVVIPLFVLVGHFIVSRFYEWDDESGESMPENRLVSGILGRNDSGEFPVRDVLILAAVGIVIVLLFGLLVAIPALILLVVLLAIKITKKTESPESTGQKTGLSISGVQLLLLMAVLMALFLLSLIVIPVLFAIITR